VIVVFVCLQPVSNPDFVIPVEIDGTIHQVRYVICWHLAQVIMCLLLSETVSSGIWFDWTPVVIAAVIFIDLYWGGFSTWQTFVQI